MKHDEWTATSSVGEEAVRFRNVCFSYPGREVLHQLDFAIEAHSFTAVVGPNGGGKTTLLKLLLGALKPTRGSIEVFGGAPARACRRIGYVPQQVAIDVRFPITVWEAVLTGRAALAGIRYGERDRAAARRALQLTGLEGLESRPFGALSGGERQRVLIAQALAAEPELLLLDEPVANVDAMHAAALYDLFKRLSKTLTVVMVSHNLAVVTEQATHVLCVNKTAGMHRLGEVVSETFRTSFGATLAALKHDHCAVKSLPEEGCGD